MKRKIKAGLTSVTLPIFVQDTSSATGAGLGSIVFNTSGLVGEYRRQGDSAWTAITLATATLGTFTSGGWIADGALTGAYEVGIPNAALAAGARWVAIRYRGVTNMYSVRIEIELDAVDYQDAAGFGLSRIDAAITSRPDAAGVRTAVGLAAANLDTQLSAINTKTTNLPGSPAAVGSAMTLDLTQALSTGQTGDTVGGALLAARADGFGKWVITGTPESPGSTLVLYAADGTTVVRTFDLATAGTRS